MENRKILTIIAPLSIIACAAMLRLIPHPANIAPIAAMALFGGTYLNKKYALVFPLIALFLSDIILGFHATMPFVYGSFLLTGLLGLWLRKHKNTAFVFGTTLLSSLLFFFITNFGVWAMTTLYPKTGMGLMESYIMGLPFLRLSMIGDFLYTGLLFGAYELLKSISLNYQFNKNR